MTTGEAESKQHEFYQSPLQGRYASKTMQKLFSDQRRFGLWRRIWLALAESQQQLGLDISDDQIRQMRENLDNIDFEAAKGYEQKFRHDVMAHIHAFGDVAPLARPIIHLGATSQFVNCNYDLLTMRDALDVIIAYVASIIDSLGKFAAEYKDMPTLGFTHYQPAQLTTVGKRACLWCYEFAMDLAELEYRRENICLRGVKGTTGTQASFLALFDGDGAKVDALDEMVCEKLNLPESYTVTGQTYTRKVDSQVVSSLAMLAQSVHKMCNDIRLLANLKEMEEPFAKNQIGSSAMAYKRNPMRCERATALSRWLMDISASPLHTAAEQWFERTLDDSANKRMAIPEAFLTADAICQIIMNISDGLVVYPKVIESRVASELPFMATENILMAAVKAGGDRQELHELIRQHSMDAAAEVKQLGRPNDLIDRLKADENFASVDIDAILQPKSFTGRASEQVDRFIAEHVTPVREKYADKLSATSELTI